MIFEYNEIKPGGASASWGNNVDTYAVSLTLNLNLNPNPNCNQGGWAGHVFHAHNTFASVWMNDREYMTFDGSSGDYFGPALQQPGSAILTLNSANGTGEHASCLNVLHGTGAGQYRSVVAWDKGGAGVNQTVTLDRALDTAVDESSLVQLGTCHMMMLFLDNYYADGGAVQVRPG